MNLARHARVLIDAWGAENRRRGQARDWTETDFLPAALEVAETPPSPIGRAILWTIIAAALAALAWACLAHVETVAVAEGRLVPEGRLRSVEAAEQGVIRAILVREGQHVTAGQTLIELDPTIAEAQAGTARSELSTALLTRARDNALLGYSAGRRAAVAAPPGAEPTAVEAERQLVASRIDEYRAKTASLAERRAGAIATVAGAQAEIVKLRRTLPLLKEALDLQTDLAKQGFGARQKLLQQQQAYVTAEQDLEGQLAKLAEARAQVAAIAGEAAEAREAFVGKAAQERAEAEGVVVTRGNVVREANQKRGLQRLKAPVSGTVQEVTVTNIGEVPEVGKPLVTIVPDGEPLVVEALLLNDVLGASSIDFADGSTRALYDVALGFQPTGSDAPVDLPVKPVAQPNPVADPVGIDAASSASSAGAVPSVSAVSPSTDSLGASNTAVGGSRGSLDGPDGPIVAADTAVTRSLAWWRDASIVGATLADLARPLASDDHSLGANLGSPIAAGLDAASLQRLQLLRQSIAALQPDSGGSAAIWAHGGAADTSLAVAAASSQTASLARQPAFA